MPFRGRGQQDGPVELTLELWYARERLASDWRAMSRLLLVGHGRRLDVFNCAFTRLSLSALLG